jgi:hypothetical protein
MEGSPLRRSYAGLIIMFALIVIAVINLITSFKAKIEKEQLEHTRAELLKRKSDTEARERRDQMAKEFIEEYEASKRQRAP